MRNIVKLPTLLLLGTLCLAQNNSVPTGVGQVQVSPDGSSTLKLDGIDITFDAQGAWSAIYSTYTQPVEFPDREGIKKAQIIAEEKGKANIVRFLNQNVQSERIVSEADNTLQTAEHTQGSGGQDKLSRKTRRQMVSSLKQFTRSYSSGNLRGITILGTGYNEKAEEAWVKVGLSRKTAAIAKNLNREMQQDSPADDTQIRGSGDPNRQPSEDRGSRSIPQ